MLYAIKDLRDTSGDKPRHEIHRRGCSHMKINVLQHGGYEANSITEVIMRDTECSESEVEEFLKLEYKVAPCLK